jgi:hypothetical protein
MDAAGFQPEISSFRLHLAAEGKAPKTIQAYIQVVTWFAAACLLPRTHPNVLANPPSTISSTSGRPS